VTVPVYVTGVGITPFGRQPHVDIATLARGAIVDAVQGAGVSHRSVGAALFSSAYETAGIGQRVLKDLGMTGIRISNIENACAGGADAFLQAVQAVEHGETDVALAVGCDMPTRLSSSGILPLLPGDPALDFGLTAPALYGLRARRYLDQWGVPVSQLAAVSVKNRTHGAANPIASFRTAVTLEEVLSSPMIADPLTRLQCCPVSDGAAAVIVTSNPAAGALCVVRGGAVLSGTLQDQAGAEDTVTSRSAEKAFGEAGIEPGDLSFCEVHDAFTIGEILAIEGLGICAPGQAGVYVAEGRATLGGGGVVVNPSGGLLSRGHPPGGTGVAQIVEAALQLSGRAGDRQVEDARFGACHTRGGGSFDLDANACAVVVLERS
jgi:acetyl-CoA acetyltransferase